jgi:hypothetical protein
MKTTFIWCKKWCSSTYHILFQVVLQVFHDFLQQWWLTQRTIINFVNDSRKDKCHYLWWFLRQSRLLQSVLVSSPLIFVQSSYYFVISIVRTYSHIFTVICGATAYQSSKFPCIHLSHLITVRVNNLLHPSCTVFLLWCCRLFAAWLVFQ